MRITIKQARREMANVLVTTMVIGGVMSVVVASSLSLSSASLGNAHSRVDWQKAFYHAENAYVWAAQNALSSPPAPGSSNYYATANGTLPLAYMLAELGANGSFSNNAAAEAGTNNITPNANSQFMNAWVSVVQSAAAVSNVLVITASARVNNEVHTIQASVTIYPPSLVFDYEYFLNNWGWWWGNTIIGNGAQRANWDFDFRYNPTVNGSIYAADQVEENEIPYNQYTESPPFGGTAGQDPTDLVHSGAPRVVMPNLLNFSNYDAIALANTASNGLWVGTNQVIYGVQTNTNSPGLYVVGTPSNPIKIVGTAVVPGDVVFSGVVTGRGTLYVGGNLYIAGDITYANGPNFSSAPETLTPAQRDAWVAQSATNDLVAYAVQGSILAGDVTDPDWINYCYNYPGSGLQYVGDESHLGADGIAGTPDDYIPFLHANGTWSTWYDADGNGLTNANYNYDTDINMTAARAAAIQGYPYSGGSPVAYSSVATDNMGNLNGIFYTDHAAAMRLDDPTSYINGVIVSRNEQIVYQDNLVINYDSRVNSRYQANPNQYINLGLPYGKPIVVNSFVELPPNPTNL
jgi:hypothetical protein